VFSTTSSGELELPSYRMTLADGCTREVYYHADGYKFYLIPKRLIFDEKSQILQENEMQMQPVYLP